MGQPKTSGKDYSAELFGTTEKQSAGRDYSAELFGDTEKVSAGRDDSREELIALRRMAELEDKAAKAPQEATPTQTTDSPIISMAPIEAPRGTAVPENDLPDNLKPEKIDALEAIQRKALLEQWGVAAMFLLGGLAVGWAVVAAIGWIVRGFMGILRIPRQTGQSFHGKVDTDSSANWTVKM